MNYSWFWAIKVIHFDLVKNNMAAIKNERLAKIWNLGNVNCKLQFTVCGLKVSTERLRFAFTPNGKRGFVPRDQVFPLFFVYCLMLLHKNMARALHKSMEKRGSVIYSTHGKNEANMMFIIWLLPGGGPETSAGRAIWQSFDRRQERSFYWLTKTIAHNKGLPRKWKQIRHVEKVYLVKTKSAVSFSSLM